jgi:hypothetical protein
MGALCLIFNLYRALFETDTDRTIRSQCAQGLRNLQRIKPESQVSRILMLVLAPLIFLPPLPLSMRILLPTYTMMGFLEACDPQTPRTGKIRQALQRFLTIQIPSPAGAKP